MFKEIIFCRQIRQGHVLEYHDQMASTKNTWFNKKNTNCHAMFSLKIFDVCIAGILATDLDSACAAREQRPHEDHSEAGQDNDHRGPPHLADPVR